MSTPQFDKEGCTLKYTLGSGETASLHYPFSKGAYKGVVTSINDGEKSAGVEGDILLVALEGVFKFMPKTTGTAWTVGQALFWNATTSKFSTVDEDGLYYGVAAVAAASGDTTGYIQLDEGIARAQKSISIVTLASGTSGTVTDARVTTTSTAQATWRTSTGTHTTPLMFTPSSGTYVLLAVLVASNTVDTAAAGTVQLEITY